MELSIVILHTNKPQDAVACLRHLQRASLPAETEIFVINNGGQNANDRVDRSAAEGLPVQFVELPRDGYVYGNNYGYKLAKGRYVATVNADITVEPDTIERMLAHLRAHEEAGLVAPRLWYPTGQEQDVARPFPRFFELVLRRLPIGYRSAEAPPFTDADFRRVDWVTGAIFIMSRRCLEATGGHDPRYYLFMSDIALCRETWNAGMEVHQLKDARATHNEKRLSQGVLWRMIRKRTGRIHVKDALTYFLHYALRGLPRTCPSVSGTR